MIQKLSFQEMNSICKTLGEFANARLQKNPDKDVILVIKKINGRETLRATRLSKMSWCARFVRWFGFGGATLKSVAHYLEDHEPCLPNFSRLKDKSILSKYLTEDAINKMTNLESEKLTVLKKQKSQGCEVFKKCLSNHNRQFSRKIYIELVEYEKYKNLCNSGSTHDDRGINHTWPNPMGVLKKEDEKTLRMHYRPPLLIPMNSII